MALPVIGVFRSPLSTGLEMEANARESGAEVERENLDYMCLHHTCIITFKSQHKKHFWVDYNAVSAIFKYHASLAGKKQPHTNMVSSASTYRAQNCAD